MKQDPLFCVEKKICIVTGGLGQLGSQFAKELLSRGARVAVFARHVSQEKIQTIFSKEQLDGKNLSFHAVDITIRRRSIAHSTKSNAYGVRRTS